MIYNSGTGEAAESLEVVLVGKPEKTITVRTCLWENDFLIQFLTQ